MACNWEGKGNRGELGRKEGWRKLKGDQGK